MREGSYGAGSRTSIGRPEFKTAGVFTRCISTVTLINIYINQYAINQLKPSYTPAVFVLYTDSGVYFTLGFSMNIEAAGINTAKKPRRAA